MITAKATFKRMKATAIMSRVNIVSADLAQVLLDLDSLNGETIGTTADDKITFAEGWRDDIKTAIEAYGISMVSAKPADYDSKVALIGPAVAVPIKTALDTANEEASATVDAAIDLVESNYAAIKAAITGVDMTGVKPSGYDDKIKQIGDKYTRPSFWPALPDIAVDENGENLESVVYLLVAVFPESGGDVGIYFNQAVTVNWGNGNTASISAGHVFKHYEYAEVVGEPNDRGYKTVLVEIRPSNNLLSYFSTQTYTRIDNVNTILDIKMSSRPAASGATTLYIRFAPMLEQIEIVGKPNLSAYGVGNSCPSLKKIIVNTSKTIVFDSLLRQDNKQQTAIEPQLSMSSATSAVGAFINLNTLNGYIHAVLPENAVSCASLFLQSSFIKKIRLDNAAFISSLDNAFSQCYRLSNLSILGVKVSFNISNCNFYYDELKRIIENDLATPATTATMTITGNPGAVQVVAAIAAGTIMVPSGWTVTS